MNIPLWMWKLSLLGFMPIKGNSCFLVLFQNDGETDPGTFAWGIALLWGYIRLFWIREILHVAVCTGARFRCKCCCFGALGSASAGNVTFTIFSLCIVLRWGSSNKPWCDNLQRALVDCWIGNPRLTPVQRGKDIKQEGLSSLTSYKAKLLNIYNLRFSLTHRCRLEGTTAL